MWHLMQYFPYFSELMVRGEMKKLGFIGGGNMAEALMRGLVEKKIFAARRSDRLGCRSSTAESIKRKLKIESTADNLDVSANAGDPARR